MLKLAPCLSSSLRKSLSLGVLYLVQGFPYGFQDKLIPLVLIEKGHSPSAVSSIRLLLLPWLAKALFAPLIDTTLTKVKWVTVSLLCLAGISMYNSLFVPADSDSTNVTIPLQLIATLFLLNFFSAIQDIAVDAIAIKVLANKKEVASGNASQIVGYKLGSFFGSSVLFYFYHAFGWSGLFSTVTFVYILVLAIFFNITRHQLLVAETSERFNDDHENDGCGHLNPQSKGDTQHNSHSSPLSSVLGFLFMYKLGESAALSTFPFYLINSGVTSQQIAFWNGICGTTVSIFGSLAASQLSQPILKKLIEIRLMPLFLQLLIITVANFNNLVISTSTTLYYGSILSVLALHLIGGLITTLTFSMMMLSCQQMPKSFRATRYTLMSTIEVLGKLFFASVSGLFVDLFGFAWAHLLFLLISTFPIFFLTTQRLDQLKSRPTSKQS